MADDRIIFWKSQEIYKNLLDIISELIKLQEYK